MSFQRQKYCVNITPLCVKIAPPCNTPWSTSGLGAKTLFDQSAADPGIPMQKAIKPKFNRYIGIDYSGAKTAESSLKGIRVYEAEGVSIPVEVQPPASPKKYWSRRGLAEWLAEQLTKETPTIVGIDHSFSFPLRYFEKHWLLPDWPSFLDDFQQHWPTDEKNMYVEFIRDGLFGNGAARTGSARWRRIAEERARAKSVFHFDVPGSVAKSTHAGLPWLRYLRNQLGEQIHFWPFDGWEIPAGKSALVEIYPSFWSKNYPREDRTPDQHDAYVATAWLQQVDRDGTINQFLKPEMLPGEYIVAGVEGWILGVE